MQCLSILDTKFEIRRLTLVADHLQPLFSSRIHPFSFLHFRFTLLWMPSTLSSPPLLRTTFAVRVGSVSYLNAKPLIYGLEDAEDVEVLLDIPSRLLAGLRQSDYDVALLPIIDYQRLENARIILGSGIACDGPTLTVRIFSRRPIEQIESLACDTDSHTSVALARVILAEHFHIEPKLVDWTLGQPASDAMLLIGDKVITHEPSGYDHQLDLGDAWKQLTGLPFVFAAWIVRGGVDVGELPARLELAKHEGLDHIGEIVNRHAVTRGWPAEIAARYMTDYLKYDVTDLHLEAIELFHRLALRHKMIPHMRGISLY
jgi:chorismate dehydratase